MDDWGCFCDGLRLVVGSLVNNSSFQVSLHTSSEPSGLLKIKSLCREMLFFNFDKE